ncbi:MAG TPA: DUF1552 domain-containing protein [Vicinamibacterales bacterium]|nr:DUF1552 domain-containing protein [Vicinamibacterales bacterium]
MFITKKHIPRRTMLKAAGVSLALPFLDAMVPAGTALAQTAAAPRLRTGFFYIPHGAIMGNTSHGRSLDMWTPSGSGATFKLSPILASLEPYKRYVSSFGNLQNAATAGSVHSFTPATWLSATRPDTGAPRAHMTTTLDQVIAKIVGQETPLPSLEVAAETTVQSAAGGGGYYSTLSFRDADSPLPMEPNPRKVFLQLFGEGDTPQERATINTRTHSLLDLILDGTNSLKGDLGTGDRAVLDGYLESVREVERRTQRAAAKDLSAFTIPEAPVGELDSFPEQVKLMFDLVALAYQADLTRVASYIMVAEGTNRTYNHIGIPDSFHPVSHHANDLTRIEKLAKIQTWHLEQFADFVKKMAETPDGQGSLLDHAIFMYGSNMSNSDRHDNYPEPNIVVGGGNGKMKLGGQHIVLPERTPIANLHLTLLQKVGVERDKFGDSTGTIAEI